MSADDDGLAELRRRLYAPGATDADRAAFAAAEAEAEAVARAARAAVPVVVAEPAAAERPSTPPPRGRTRVPWFAAAGVLVVASAVAVALGHPFAPAPVRPSPTPTTARTIAVPAAVRDGFLRDLRAGRDPGLLDYLNTHPATLLGPLMTAGRTDTTGVSGVGPSTVNLSPQAALRSGHVTLVLVTERDARFAWTPTTVAESNDRSGPEVPVATDAGTAVAGEPVLGTVDFSGGVPSRLTLLLPAGVHWGAVVVYTG